MAATIGHWARARRAISLSTPVRRP
jgi:hypothetical protein